MFLKFNLNAIEANKLTLKFHSILTTGTINYDTIYFNYFFFLITEKKKKKTRD